MFATYYLPSVHPYRYGNPLNQSYMINRLFNDSFPWEILKSGQGNQQKEYNQILPTLDILSDQQAYTINVEIPGVNADNVKLEVKDGALVISGEKQAEKTTDTGHTKHIAERSWGSFYRALRLPEDADIDQITATHKNGVLSINVPKITSQNTNKTISIAHA